MLHQGSPDVARLVAYDDRHALRGERLSRAEDVVNHRHAGHPVQHLGQVGLHAGPLAGGEDDDVQV